MNSEDTFNNAEELKAFLTDAEEQAGSTTDTPAPIPQIMPEKVLQVMEPDAPPTPEFSTNKTASGPKTPTPKYLSEPSIKDQFSKMPETIRMGSREGKFFRIPADLDAYNEMIRNTSETSPRLIILSEDLQPVNGEWTVFVKTQEILYQKL